MTDDVAPALARVEKELLARWPESRIEWKLERMTALMHAMGDPHLAYPVVHVAGRVVSVVCAEASTGEPPPQQRSRNLTMPPLPSTAVQ